MRKEVCMGMQRLLLFSLAFYITPLELQAQSKKATTEAETSDFTELIQSTYAKDCVVTIHGYQMVGDTSGNATIIAKWGGSGFVTDLGNERMVVTAGHVAENATHIWASFNQSKQMRELEIVGYDRLVDVAITRFKDKKFKPPCTLAFGDSDAVKEGDPVFAIGSSLSGFMLSTGRVMRARVMLKSWKDNFIGLTAIHLDALLSDVKINAGDSGGPLLNKKGEVIAINVQQFADPETTADPVAISVAINSLKTILPELRKTGGRLPHGNVNVLLRDSEELTSLDYKAWNLVQQNRNGALIFEVAILSSAERHGLERNDIIVAVNGIRIATAKDFYTLLVLHLKPNTVAKITVLRKNEYKILDIPVEEFFIQ